MAWTGRGAAALMLAAMASGTAAAQPQAKTAAQIEQELAANRAAEAALEAQLAEAKRLEAEATLERYAAMAEEAAAAKAYLASQQPPAAETGEAAEPDPNLVQETTTTTETSNGTETKTEVVKTYSQAALRDSETGTQKFGGIEFGIGIAFSYDLGDNDRIKEAEVVNGIVRVTDQENVGARIILESHYLFTPVQGFFANIAKNVFDLENRRGGVKTWGVGPFMALQPGTDNIIEAVGAGLMMGFRRPGTESDSFNIGVGILYDLNVRTLGEGILADEALPEGEEDIRYLEQEQSALLVMTSYSF